MAAGRRRARGGTRAPDGRRAALPAAEEAERLVSGAAWEAYCEALRAAGRHLLGAHADASPELRAEGFRYLLGMVSAGIGQALVLADPDQPRFLRNPDSDSKWGAENADNQYLWARVRPDARYRIHGERGSAFDFLIEVKEGYMQLGGARNFATLTAGELAYDAAGRFEIWLGGEPTPGREGSFLPLHPDARYVAIRQYFCDWERERPARFWIERVGAEGLPPAPLDPARMGARLGDAAEWTLESVRFWTGWVDALRRDHQPGRLAPARKFVGGADDIYYGNDLYRIGADEALLIETELPAARYWSFQLCDLWFRSADWANRQTSLNQAQAHVDADGRFRCVVSHRDPGVVNWLDAGGAEEGMIQYRWIWSPDNPAPAARRVPFDRVRDLLPADTPRVDAAERRRAIAVRQRHRAFREPVT